MPKQINNPLNEVRIPFAKMSFTPDVPSTALGPNEYNDGQNIETDVRGIRSVAGDQEFLSTIPGTPTFITGGYRQPQSGKQNSFYFITATTQGYWYASNGMSAWQDITPVSGPFTTYTQATNITEAWNGTVPFFNDESHPPMFWQEFTGTSLATTGASSAAGTTTITFDNQNDAITGVVIDSHTGEFSYTNKAALKAGQKVTISGTNTNTTTKALTNVSIVDKAGAFICDSTNLAVFTATINDGTPPGSGTVLTVTAVASGTIETGMVLTAGSIDADTTITGQVSGTTGGIGVYTVDISQEHTSQTITGTLEFGLTVGQTVTVAGTITNTTTPITGVKIASTTGDFTCTAGTLAIGQQVEIAGTITNVATPLSTVQIISTTADFTCAPTTLAVGQTITFSGSVSATPYTLSGVTIDNVTGEFTCTASSLAVGQVITIAGGQTNTTATNLTGIQTTGVAGQFSKTDATVLTAGMVISISGAAGGTGSIVGYTNPQAYKVSVGGTATFTLVNIDGSAIVTTVGTITQTVDLQSPAILGYANPTNYFISATNGTTTFTLKAMNGQPLNTRGGTPLGLTYTVLIPAANGYVSPKDYLVTATNGTTTFTVTELDGTVVTTQGGSLAGMTIVIKAPAITGYSNPKPYQISDTNGTTAFTLVELDGLPLVTTGGTPTGLTYTIKAPSITGYTNPTNYYISATNGATGFTLVDANDDPIVTVGGKPTGLTYTVQAPSVSNGTYFIIETNKFSTFRLSTTFPTDTPIATNAGTPAGLTYIYTPFAQGQQVLVEGIVPIAFRGLYTATAVTNNSVSFAGSVAGPQTVAGAVSDPYPKIISYSNILPASIKTKNGITYLAPNIQRITLQDSLYTTAPYLAGDYILISDVNQYYNGQYEVVASTTTTIDYYAVPGGAFPNEGGTVSPAYSWNYNPNWASVYAKFMRLYNTPNVGCILVAGGLTATELDGTTREYPVTVQWSQAFGLNEAPLTWQPTITNVANQLEVPLRGAALDAFPAAGKLFLCSYWDTVVFSPLNYSTTSAPILGVSLANQGRGLLTANCWANTDKMVYGIDARDIWVFDGQDFQGIGNQRVKNWFYDQLDPQYYDRVFMETNTQKNQIEIYYPDRSAVNGVPNKMLAYRHDIDVWNAPRNVTKATMACESPIWTYNGTKQYWEYNSGSRTVVYANGSANQQPILKDYGYSFIEGAVIVSKFRRDNIKLLPDYSGKMMVHRILPEAVNMGATPFTVTDEIVIIPSTGTINVKVEGANSVGQQPVVQAAVTMTLNTDNPWIQVDQNAYRVNALEIGNTSNTNIWMCSAATWQYTQTEDDR